MFTILVVGLGCGMKGLITKEGNKTLSAVALYIVNPLLIFMSYQSEYSSELLHGLLWSFLLSAVSFGVMIGVTDIEKSLTVYRDILGYDQVVYDKTGVFDDWGFMDGSEETYRRVLLTHSETRKGPFSEIFGKSYIELVVALDREPKKIFEGRYWGDPGFIQLCMDVVNMRELEKFCISKGHPFTVDSCPAGVQFDMGDASGHFTYIEDPDGTLIEFVEAYKIPIVKKLGWFLDLRKRDPAKPLPKWLLGCLRWSKVKFD